MHIDPRLNDIDDCLYRVAARLIVLQDNKVLLIKERSHGLWALPGGGIDHGDSIQSSLLREIQEEIGVPPGYVSCDFEIVYYNIGTVVNAVPRMNLYFKASIAEGQVQKTSHISELAWFTKDEFLTLQLHSSYNKGHLEAAIWGDGGA
ncbi:MAG TPA: NUDIX hydrolase [Candidatus Saccharimonadales bacterium]|nr:NUDIX hydrolase [Candidatus Saccharimonadales bacterium]